MTADERSELPSQRRTPPQEPREGFTAIGRVLRPHGLSGEARVQAFNPAAPNLVPGTRVSIGGAELSIEAVRPANDSFIVAFKDVGQREDIEKLRGWLIEVPDASIEPEEGAYFVHDLIGLTVVTNDGEDLGVVVDVLQPGANDVYVVDGPHGELLLPAIGEVIQEIDVSTRRMVITLLPGLLDESR